MVASRYLDFSMGVDVCVCCCECPLCEFHCLSHLFVYALYAVSETFERWNLRVDVIQATVMRASRRYTLHLMAV